MTRPRDLDGVMAGGPDGRLYRVYEPSWWRVDRWVNWWLRGDGLVQRALRWVFRRRLGMRSARGVLTFTIGGKKIHARAVVTERKRP